MSKKILLADDSVTIQKVVELTFMDEGVTVVAVGNGSDAIARLAEVNPDVVIADVHMPGASGYEVASKAKAWRPSVPVLLLVGTFEPFSKEEFAACGANASMKKPFDSQELLREVTAMLAMSGEGATVVAEADDASALAELPPLDDTASGWQLDDSEELDATGGLSSAATPIALAAPLAPSVFAMPAPATAPPPAPAAPMAVSALAPAAAPAANGEPISDGDIDRIARRVVELIGDRIVREVSWEVIPDLAEVVIKDRLRELESQVE
ncbi:MAG: response regulator [Acidobacteriota bacterium]